MDIWSFLVGLVAGGLIGWGLGGLPSTSRLTTATAVGPKLRTVEVRGVHYVERKIGGQWYRLAPTWAGADGHWAPRAWWSHYPPQEFATEDDARTAMIAEAGRELAEIPIVKAEL